jgi:ribosomal protein L37AE/L43A
MLMLTNEPWIDEDRRQAKLEAHMNLFPVCAECGRTMMNSSLCVHIKNRWYCDICADVVDNSEMRSDLGID